MPNSTGGNKVSILPRQTPQAREDRAAERIAAVASKTKKDYLDKVIAAKSAADTVQSAKRRLQKNIECALEAVYTLLCQFRPDPAGRPEPVLSTAGVNVRSGGISYYDTTKLVRLILGGELNPASLRACVELLRLAEKEDIAPNNFRRFVKKFGGVEVNTKIVHKSAKQPGTGAALLKHPAQSR